MERWFLHSQGSTLGPLAEDQVLHGLETGELQPNDKIYTVHANSWGPLSEHPHFGPKLAALNSRSARNLVPPPPPRFLRGKRPPEARPTPPAVPSGNGPALPLERPSFHAPRPAPRPPATTAAPPSIPAQDPPKTPAAKKAAKKRKAPRKERKPAEAKAAEASVPLAAPPLPLLPQPAPAGILPEVPPQVELTPPVELDAIPLPELAPELEFVPALPGIARKPEAKQEPKSVAVVEPIERKAEVIHEPAPQKETRPVAPPLSAPKMPEPVPAPRLPDPPVNVIRFELKMPSMPFRGIAALCLAIAIAAGASLYLDSKKTRDLKDSRLPDPSSPTTVPLETGDPIPPLKAPTRPQRD